MFKVKNIARKIISTITLAAFIATMIPTGLFADQSMSTLAPWLGITGGNAKQLIYFTLHIPPIIYAESDGAIALLERYCADALSLPNGRFLVSKKIFDNNEKIIKLFEKHDIEHILKGAEGDPEVRKALFKLTRVILHEKIEKLMRVIAATDNSRYAAIKTYVLSNRALISAYNRYFSTTSGKKPPRDELFSNDIIASAFEIILLEKAGIVDKNSLNPAEAAFADTAERLFKASKLNCFTAEFWDEEELNRAIEMSLHIGYTETIVAHPREKSKSTVLKPIEKVKTGDEVGIKVKDRVRENNKFNRKFRI